MRISIRRKHSSHWRAKTEGILNKLVSSSPKSPRGWMKWRKINQKSIQFNCSGKNKKNKAKRTEKKNRLNSDDSISSTFADTLQTSFFTAATVASLKIFHITKQKKDSRLWRIPRKICYFCHIKKWNEPKAHSCWQKAKWKNSKKEDF